MSAQRFSMTDDQLATLLDACKPVPYLVANGTEPASPQENANRAWQALGAELGFDWLTVTPAGADQRVFYAKPTAEEASSDAAE
jgi:hypothetical protein